ncbi:DUF6491 family protein [Caulobacter sp.]|uniref:DUF6491 family protein n=1 Tax=Caulobacter sp. TaxID=78 RepID=UPI001B1F7539|nr:DUF6491 family protein [Caulobacter sp.]MBO9545950.1 hypothetical protein [Caulobacter sp.]
MRVLIGSIVLAALLSAGPALAADAKPERTKSSCFRPDDVNGFTVIDDRTVDVTISPKTVYRLTLFSPSPDIDWSLRIGIYSRGRSWVCSGYDAEIIVPETTGRRTYPVTDVRKLTPEELAAEKKK